MSKKRKIIICSDIHSGHMLALTHPDWLSKSHPLYDLMIDFWKWFEKETKKEKFDIAIWNGDLLDGEGRGDSSFHITTDINEQVEMCSKIIEVVGAQKNVFVTGTPYHSGKILDYETIIANKFGGDIKSRQKLEINGVRFDVAHTISKTSTPVGGDLARKKAILWNILQDELNGRRHADYIVRSHIHEWGMLENDFACVMTTPALQIGSREYNRYARKMENSWYTVGFLTGEIDGPDKHHIYRKQFKYTLPEDEYIEC